MIVAFVPIKLNSQRLPHKNILPLKDKPLCWYIFSTLLSIKSIDKVYVYCSTFEIMKYVPEGVIFLKRSEDLDSDDTLGIDIYKKFTSEVYSDIYVLAHATSPYLTSFNINKGIMAVNNPHSNNDSALSVYSKYTFAWFDGKPLNYNHLNIPRTQDIKPVLLETSGFYIFKKSVIDSNRRIGDSPAFIEVEGYEAIDIDTEIDYLFAKSRIEN